MVLTYADKEGKRHGLSKCKATKGFQMINKEGKILDCKKKSSSYATLANCQISRQELAQGDHPVRPPAKTSQESKSVNDWICKNSSCKAVLTSEDAFCKRCSCCICHLFDDNKDPSLWLVCTSEFGDMDCCGLSCHIECAFLRQIVGVFNIDQSMLVDGSYCCAVCGKVSGIIGCWKRQLIIAKDARRVDVLCYRISLSYRLLDGTSQFKELHQIVKEAKTKLETEVGPVNGVSARMARGIVSRLSIASDVQKLCSVAIEKADDWLKPFYYTEKFNRDSLPAACRIQFEDITYTSLVIVLRETSSLDAVMGYKLWYCDNKEQEDYKREPVFFPREQRRILISNLQPCTKYAFKIISYTDDGDIGHSIAKCFTKSKEIINKQTDYVEANMSLHHTCRKNGPPNARSSGFKVRNLGKILQLACAQEEGCCHDSYPEDMEQESHDGNVSVTVGADEEDQEMPAVVRQLDLNDVSVPDLNAKATTPAECSPGEENGCSTEKNEQVWLSGNVNLQACEAMVIDESRPDCGVEAPGLREESHEIYCSLISGSADQKSLSLGQLNNDYEYCVRVIRWLERLGHITDDFRKKFLTWFSLRSTERERRVVITFIRTLFDDPSSLAGQLLDSFSEIVACKRLRTGLCSKLWH